MRGGLRAASLRGHNFDAAVMAWDLKRSKAKERGEERKGRKGVAEAGGGGYIRRVMAGMKPIANDAGIRDWQAKRCAASGPASRCLPACLPGRLDVAAISNVHCPGHRNKFNRNTLRVGIRQLGR